MQRPMNLAAPRPPSAEQGMIKGEDTCYFQHGDPLVLPVYRVIRKSRAQPAAIYQW
jgi:hypothetical protein